MAKKTEADNFVEAVSQHAELTEVMKRESEKNVAQVQYEKEEAIANIYEMSGKIKAASFNKAQSEFLELLMLKQVKDAKEYREKFGMTWEQFCNHVGVNRRTIDNILIDLKPFKVEFLAKFANFAGFPINKIKYLEEPILAGVAKIEGNEIVCMGERIPFEWEYREDFQELLNKLQEEHKAQIEERDADLRTKDRLLKDKENVIRKQARDLSKYEKSAETKGLTPEEDAYLQRMENLRTAFDGFYMFEVDPEVMTELWSDNDPTPRMRAAYLSTLDYMRKQILAAYDIATVRYGNPIMCPEEGWSPGMGAALSKDDVLKTKQ
jgi:transcriptional regulator with XRE-family HTH domain